jgi:hypothetical protein
MAAPPLRAAPDPAEEPIVLVIDGQTIIVQPDDPAWRIALYAREEAHAHKLTEGDLRGKRALIAELRKNKADEAEKARKSHPERCAIERVFETWRTESGHTRCKLTPERFDMTACRFAEEYDEGDLTMAAIGVATNPYVIEGDRKDDYKTAMQSGEQVERYANRCPADRRRQLSGKLFEVA